MGLHECPPPVGGVDEAHTLLQDQPRRVVPHRASAAQPKSRIALPDRPQRWRIGLEPGEVVVEAEEPIDPVEHPRGAVTPRFNRGNRIFVVRPADAEAGGAFGCPRGPFVGHRTEPGTRVSGEQGLEPQR